MIDLDDLVRDKVRAQICGRELKGRFFIRGEQIIRPPDAEETVYKFTIEFVGYDEDEPSRSL